MTPREAVYAYVRSWNSDDVAEYPETEVPGWSRAEHEAWRKRSPVFHDEWSNQFTDDLFAVLDVDVAPTRAAIYRYVRESIVDVQIDGVTNEEYDAMRADDDARAERDTERILSLLMENGYPVKEVVR